MKDVFDEVHCENKSCHRRAPQGTETGKQGKGEMRSKDLLVSHSLWSAAPSMANYSFQAAFADSGSAAAGNLPNSATHCGSGIRGSAAANALRSRPPSSP